MIFQSHPVFGIPQNLRQISQGFPPKKCHLSQPITGPGRRTTATQRPERWESPGTYSKLGGSCLENMVAPWQRYEKHRKTIGKQWGDSEISTISSMVLVYLPKKMGDFVRANVGKYSTHGAYDWVLWNFWHFCRRVYGRSFGIDTWWDIWWDNMSCGYVIMGRSRYWYVICIYESMQRSTDCAPS